jgi:hypothetical protein
MFYRKASGGSGFITQFSRKRRVLPRNCSLVPVSLSFTLFQLYKKGFSGWHCCDICRAGVTETADG